MFDVAKIKPAILGIGGLEAPLDEETSAIQQTLNRFALDIMRPIGETLDKMTAGEVVEPGSPLFDYIREFDKLGLGPAAVAEMAPEQAVKFLPVVFEEMGYGDPGLGLLSMILKFPATAALQTGNPELIEQFGERLGCWIATQPDRGSDVVDMEGGNIYPGKQQQKGNLTARVFDDHVILSGQTSAWVSGAPIAECALTYCAADYGQGLLKPDGTVNGIVLLVDFDLPGVSKGKPLEKLGQRPLPQGEVFFDDVRIEKKYVLIEDDGFQQSFFSALTFGNMEMACIFTGVARAAYEHALGYVHERVQGGVPLIEHQLTRYRVFELFRKVECIRAMAQRTVAYNYLTDPHCLASVTSKTTATELALEVVSEALQLFGGNGLTREYPMEKLMRDTRAAQVEDGENYMLKLKGGNWLSEAYSAGAI